MDLPRPEDTWLVEALATYLSRGVLPEIIPGITPWRRRPHPRCPTTATPTTPPQSGGCGGTDRSPGRPRRTGTAPAPVPHAAATAGDLAAYCPAAGGHDVPTSAIDLLIRPAPTPNTNAAHPS
ncbi:MAG: hypothetical protein M3460_26460 [Actinomycetota bacterium]|nr:hypothetical protein [Actinomycetota bacterium]